ncbi:MAG: hypothetical protein B6I31_04050 [Desulfobacteraceae bacterium 4572_19]|nr:MAG: hypothetical protein B6I31_04050 [Desulfobacteraceae bacterium 4572_19]
MDLLEWSDSLSVEILSIDLQHKKLVKMANVLHQAIAKGEPNSTLEEIFQGLVEYTVEHFAYEEELFTQYGYEHNEKHVKEHQGLIAEVGKLSYKLENNEGFMLGIEVMVFLKEWILNHIQGSDKQYSSFLKSKGVQ